VLPKIEKGLLFAAYPRDFPIIAYHLDGTPIYQDVFTKAALTPLFEKGVLVPATESAFPIIAYKLDGMPYYPTKMRVMISPKAKRRRRSPANRC